MKLYFRDITLGVSFSLIMALAIFSSSCSSSGNDPMPAVKSENSKRLSKIEAIQVSPLYPNGRYEGIDDITYDEFGRVRSYTRIVTLSGGELSYSHFAYEYKADSIIVSKDGKRKDYYIVKDGLIIEDGNFSSTRHGIEYDGGIGLDNIKYDNMKLVSTGTPGNISYDCLTWDNGNVVKVTDDDSHEDYFYTEQPCKTPMIYCVFFETCDSPYDAILPLDEGSGLLLAQCGFYGESLTKNIISHNIYSGRPKEIFGNEYNYDFDPDGYVTRKYWINSNGYPIGITYTWE